MMEFGMRVASHSILKQINKDINNGNNLIVSPFSLHVALNILASASSGRTLEQLLRFLQCENIDELNAQSSHFMELANGVIDDSDEEDHSLRGDPAISLLNGVWLDQQFSMKHSFKELTDDVFNADAKTVDFKNQVGQITHEINSWARKISKGCIDPLVPPGWFTEELIFVLANAVYFNGAWEKPFYDTEDEDFYLLNGETIEVPFMNRPDTKCLYGSFEGFEQLKLFYKQGQYKHRYSMTIFLPDKKDGLPELVKKFHSDPNFLLEDRELELVVLEELWVPRLKYEYQLKAMETMIELGLDIPFGAASEFGEMVEEDSKDQVYVSNVLQKCFIDVNEEGTIATALTAIAGIGGCMPPKPSPISFVADHPFLFMITEEHSGIPIFVGAALNPAVGLPFD